MQLTRSAVRRVSLVLALLLSVMLLIAVKSSVAEVAVPGLSGRVVDLTNTLSAGDITSLSSKLQQLEAAQGSQIAVLLVPTTEGEDIQQYAMRVVEQWKLGREGVDDGVLLLVALSDRVARIEVGYGLEGAIPDITAKRIIEEILLPQFRNGDIPGGISLAVDALIATAQGEKLPAAPEDVFALLPVFVIGGVMFGTVVMVFSSRVTAALAGGSAAFLAAIILSTFLVGVISAAIVLLILANNGSFGGGRGGYRSGSGGRMGGGGFSGGGGSFGGGGASGRW